MQRLVHGALEWLERAFRNVPGAKDHLEWLKANADQATGADDPTVGSDPDAPWLPPNTET